MVVIWLTTFTLLLDVLLGFPCCHSSIRLLMWVLASVCAVAALLVAVAELGCGLSCLLCCPPVQRGCPGNLIWALLPIGLSRVASRLWFGAGNLQVAPL